MCCKLSRVSELGVLFDALGLPIVIRFFFLKHYVFVFMHSHLIIEPFIFKGHTTFQRLIAREPPSCLWFVHLSRQKIKSYFFQVDL